MAGAGFRTFVDLDILTAAQVNTYLMEQAVMVFDDATDRSTQLGASVAEGMVSYRKDGDVLEVYNGSAWIALDDPNAIQNSIVDAKGDIITATANDTPARLAVGTNEHRLVADSATSTGLKYVADTTNYAIAAKGDLLVGSAADTVAALSVGTNDFVLTADSNATNGVKWAAIPAVTPTGLVKVGTAAPSGASSTSFNNVFTSTYETYLITYRLTNASGTNNLCLRFRASGTDDSNASYNEQFAGFADTTASVLKQSTQTLTILATLSTNLLFGYVYVSGPQLAAVTFGIRSTVDNAVGYTSQRLQLQSFNFNAATQFDGFTLFPSASNFTGQISVYGLEK